MVDPLVLVMDDRRRLGTSPHTAAKTSAAYGYAEMGEDLAEGQASVKDDLDRAAAEASTLAGF